MSSAPCQTINLIVPDSVPPDSKLVEEGAADGVEAGFKFWLISFLVKNRFCLIASRFLSHKGLPKIPNRTKQPVRIKSRVTKLVLIFFQPSRIAKRNIEIISERNADLEFEKINARNMTKVDIEKKIFWKP